MNIDFDYFCNSFCHCRPFPMHMFAQNDQHFVGLSHTNRWYYGNKRNIDLSIPDCRPLDISRICCHIGYIFFDYLEIHLHYKLLYHLQYTNYTFLYYANRRCTLLNLKYIHVYFHPSLYPWIGIIERNMSL